MSGVGEDGAERLRQRTDTGRAIVDVARCHAQRFDQDRARIGTEMGREAASTIRTQLS